jgi:hypothetical protein
MLARYVALVFIYVSSCVAVPFSRWSRRQASLDVNDGISRLIPFFGFQISHNLIQQTFLTVY